MKTLVIMPAYNVEKDISPMLDYFVSNDIDALVVNDGSSDNTGKIIHRYSIPYLDIPVNSGVSKAILEGIRYAKTNEYTHIITIDSDGQHSPAHLKDFFIGLTKCDYVFGNRFHDFENVPDCKLNANSLVSALYKELFGVWIPDISCGFKGYKMSDELLNAIEKDSDFSLIYTIVNHVVKNRKEFITVAIEPIYNPDAFLSTRRIEIKSFFSSLSRFDDNWVKKYMHVDNAVCEKKDFDLILSGVHYYAFYITRNDSYILQADMKAVKKLYIGGVSL